ncbi:unnamed protein product, partial [Effrenium voratum]
MGYNSMAETAAAHLQQLLPKGDAASVAEVLEAMVSGGVQLEKIPGRLLKVEGAPFATVASVVAGLGERGIEGEEMQACARMVRRQSLEAGWRWPWR